MPINDYLCPMCEYCEEIYTKIEEATTHVVLCPNCGDADLHLTFRKAPMGRIGGEKSTRSIESMKDSFNQRFIKKDLDDVRHKHGVLYDDSIRSAAVARLAAKGKV